jgi:hypothetical protein
MEEITEPPIRILRIDAAKRQLATAIQLYLENCDPISVDILAKAAAEIIDRICVLNGTPGMRATMIDMIVPGKRDDVGAALNKAANFFKHASSKKPDTVPFEFSDEQNLFTILMAVDGLRLLRTDLLEAKVFGDRMCAKGHDEGLRRHSHQAPDRRTRRLHWNNGSETP